MSTSSLDRVSTGRVSGLRLGWALFAGSLAWLAHLIGQSALNGWACRTGQLWPFHVLTAVTLAICLHALWTSWRISRDADPGQAIRAARFLGVAGTVLNTFDAVMVVVEWVPVLVVHPCATG